MSIRVSESHSGSGLLVAEQAADHEQVARLLRGHDPRLRLVPQTGGARRGVLWQVYAYNGPDQDASYVCSWTTPDGEPLPLSSRLLDKVQELDLRTRGVQPDVNEANRKHQERVLADRERTFSDLADDHGPYIDRGRRSVSMGPRPTRQPADHI